MRPLHKNARTSSPLGKGAKAFTLIEMLLSTMLGGMVVGVVAFTFANVAGSFAERPVAGETIGWNADGDKDGKDDSLPFSPAYSQLPQAFGLQAEMQLILQAAANVAGAFVSRTDTGAVTAVYVLSSAAGQALPYMPDGETADDFSFITTALSSASAASLASSQSFANALTIASPDSRAGYSVYYISGVDTVCLAVHCRWETSGANTVYRVKAYATDGTFCPTLSYAFGTANTNSTVLPGARAIKLRSNDIWKIDEDVGTQVVLPDPSIVAYQVAPGDASSIRTYSRFVMFLPLNP